MASICFSSETPPLHPVAWNLESGISLSYDSSTEFVCLRHNFGTLPIKFLLDVVLELKNVCNESMVNTDTCRIDASKYVRQTCSQV